MYMKRLEPFLVSMKAFVEVAVKTEVFVEVSDINSYLWVSNTNTPVNLLQENKLMVYVGSNDIYSYCKKTQFDSYLILTTAIALIACQFIAGRLARCSGCIPTDWRAVTWVYEFSTTLHIKFLYERSLGYDI